MVKRYSLVLFIVALAAVKTAASPRQTPYAVPQDTTVKEKPQNNGGSRARKWLVGSFHSAAYSGTLMILNNAWYKNYPKAPLHSFNDKKEWLQVDKIGHGWSAYGLSRSSTTSWKWSGHDDRHAALLGSLSGFGFMTAIELLDGRSQKWGWSWSDMAANAFGTGLFLGQQLAWNEQRILFKFSFHRNDYASSDLNRRADDLFGSSWYERMLKDYNGQTYWLSTNIKSFAPNSSMPPWFNIAVGYGAEGLFGGFENLEKRADGSIAFDRRDVPRVRQFFLSPDIDFQRLGIRSKWLRSLCFILNGFKLPAPAVLLDSRGKFRAYWFYF